VRPQRTALAMHATPIQMREPAQTAVLMGSGRKMPSTNSAVGRPQAKTYFRRLLLRSAQPLLAQLTVSAIGACQSWQQADSSPFPFAS
jgi:hypothetical protein